MFSDSVIYVMNILFLEAIRALWKVYAIDD